MTQQIFNSVPWYRKMKLLRVAKGWSQREAAEKCLTNQKAYWNWEKGKRYPRRSSRKVMCDAFGVETEEIFSDKDNDVKNS